MNSGAPEGVTVPAPLVAPVMFKISFQNFFLALKILVQARDKHKDVTWLNQLMGSQLFSHLNV
jgi:hypothetical protein